MQERCQLKVLSSENSRRDLKKEVVDRAFDLGGRDLIKAPRGVPDHVGNVDVRQLANPCLPEPEDHLDRVALGGIGGVEKDRVVVLRREPLDLGLVDRRVVHDEQDVCSIDREEGEQLAHVGDEHVGVDRAVEKAAVF